jgi:hypothetical protein
VALSNPMTNIRPIGGYTIPLWPIPISIGNCETDPAPGRQAAIQRCSGWYHRRQRFLRADALLCPADSGSLGEKCVKLAVRKK